jgi:hypothetical protein
MRWPLSVLPLFSLICTTSAQGPNQAP